MYSIKFSMPLCAATHWLFDKMQVSKSLLILQLASKWQHWGEKRAFPQGESMKTHRGKGKNSRGGRSGEKMVETDTSAEVRDEKGKILFSFHVIKYLLWLHINPTDRHSGLKEH